MKKKIFNKQSFLLILVILALLAALALTFTACNDREAAGNETEAATESEKEISFTVEVTKSDGSKKTFTVSSSEDNVGDALVEEGIISGEEGSYGWFITTVDGEFHKWEEDGKYWAFYIDGEYAMSGVSSTPITEGATYSFKPE